MSQSNPERYERRSRTISPTPHPDEPDIEPLQQIYLNQERMVNRQVTASIFHQQLDVVDTSRSDSQSELHEVDTAPNVAHTEQIPRAELNPLKSSKSKELQATHRGDVAETHVGQSSLSELPESLSANAIGRTFSSPTQASSLLQRRFTPTEFTRGGYQEQSTASIMATASITDAHPKSDRGHREADAPSTEPLGSRPLSDSKAGRQSLTTRATIDGTYDRSASVVEWLQNNHQHQLRVEEEDYFGDSTGEDGDLTPVVPARNLNRPRSSTPEIVTSRGSRVRAADADSRSGNVAQDELSSRPPPIETGWPGHQHGSRRHVEFESDLYPSPLRPNQRQQAISSSPQEVGVTNESPSNAIPSRTLRGPRFLPAIHWRYKINREDPREDQDQEDIVVGALLDVGPSHWALCFIQGFIWSALIVYLFWRISRLEKTVSFDCYDLKLNLLQLVPENITLPLVNTTISNGTLANNATCLPANVTLYTLADEHTNASSIIIPQEFQSKLDSHCILEPVNPAVVLASYFEVLFIMMLVACGVAHVLQLVALQQLRSTMRKSGMLSTKTLLIKVTVQVVAIGVASSSVVAAAWGIRGGEW